MSDTVQPVGDQQVVDHIVPIHNSSPVQNSAPATGASIPNDQSSVQQQTPQAAVSVLPIDQGSQQPTQEDIQTAVSGGHKEQEPILNADEVESEELLQPSEQEPTLHPEVQEAGVEAVSHTPELTLEDKKAGLQLTNEAAPVQTQPNGVVQLSLSEDQVKSERKSHTSVWDSVTWKLLEMLRYYQRMNRRTIHK